MATVARNRLLWTLLKILAALWVIAWWIALVAILPIFAHQIAQERFRDSARLKVVDWQSAPEGLVLIVASKSEIVKVQQQQRSFRRPFITVPHRSLATASSDRRIVLVPYPFTRGGEWYLELYGADRSWWSMSPYFRDEPDLGSEAWRRLWEHPEGQPVLLPADFKDSKL